MIYKYIYIYIKPNPLKLPQFKSIKMYFMTLSRPFLYIPTIKKKEKKEKKKKKERGEVINQSLQLFYVLVFFYFFYCKLLLFLDYT